MRMLIDTQEVGSLQGSKLCSCLKSCKVKSTDYVAFDTWSHICKSSASESQHGNPCLLQHLQEASQLIHIGQAMLVTCGLQYLQEVS